MFGIIFSNIDIFFTIILIFLYLINVFFIKDLFFRFLIFFISEFVGIMNLLFIFYKQENFLILLLLNIVFMLLIVYVLFYSKNNKEIIDIPIGENKNSTIITSMVFFIIVFTILSISFVKIHSTSIMTSNDTRLMINNRSYIKNKNGVDIKNEIINMKNGKIDYQYVKQPSIFGKAEFLKKYNYLIICYATFVVFMFFTSKSNKDRKVYKDAK